MQIHRLDPANRQDIRKFIEFPFQLYRGQKNWVPPLRSSIRAIINPQHPIHQRAEIDFFIAEKDGRTAGRIAVVNNYHYNEYTGKQAAFFSYFECIDDVDVSDALFVAAFQWAQERGLTRILGPRGLAGSDPGGVLIEGFEHPAVLTVPYNPPYYDKLVSHAGFERVTDHLSGRLLREEYQLPEKVEQIAQRVIERQGFTVQEFRTVDEILPWVERIKEAHIASFALNHEFYPPTEEEYNETIQTLLQIVDPPLLQVVSKEEQVIAFILVYPDISDGFRKAKGNLYPLGWYHLLQAKKNSQTIMVNGLAIIPGYRGRGTNALMYLSLRNAIYKANYQRLEAVMVNETNFTSKADNETLGVVWYKRHRSYLRIF